MTVKPFLMALTLSVLAAPWAMAQTYPSKPIKIVVPNAAGGAADITARTVGQVVSQSIGQSVVVENKTGASGTLGTAQLQWLAAQLPLLKSQGLFRIVLLHHPPADGVVSARKALTDRAALRAVLKQHGAELVLHGHSRDARFDPIRGPAGLVPVLGVPSISAIPNPKDEGARWNLFDLSRAGARWTIEVTARRWSPAAETFITAARYRLV